MTKQELATAAIDHDDAPARPDALALANRLRPTLLHLARHLRREVHALGISAGQVSLLAVIREHPGIGIADLAQHEGTTAPSVCIHIDRLEAAGLVLRDRESSSDRRRVGLRITAEGTRVLRTVRSRRTAWLAARLDAMTPEQLAALDAAVEPLTAILGHRS